MCNGVALIFSKFPAFRYIAGGRGGEGGGGTNVPILQLEEGADGALVKIEHACSG